MALERTIAHPGEDPSGILEMPILKLVVVGDRMSLVEKADYLAGEAAAGVDRYVIWYQEPELEELKTRYPELRGHTDFKAFALSTLNKVADVIDGSDREDMIRLDRAFTRAGLPKYNQ